MTDRTRKVLAWILGSTAVVLIITMFLGSLFFPDPSVGRLDSIWLLAWTGFPAVGMLISSQRSETRIGWILIGIGLSIGLGLSGVAYAELVVIREVLDLPAPLHVLWAADVLFVPAFVLIPFLILHFPQDHLPSSRWRWPVRLAAGVALLDMVAWAVRPTYQLTGEGIHVDNPFAIEAVASLSETLIGTSGSVLAAFGVATIVNLIWRYFRSRGEHRLQMKWFVYAAVMFVVMFFAGVVAEGIVGVAVSNVIVLFAFLVGFNGLAAAIGVAVMRYRLYEIDLVISRSLVFAGLAGFITAIYVGIVVGVGTLLGAGDEPNLALSIVATGVVAVAFQPVRERLTRLANRLMFGKRATPYEILSKFSSHLGDTVATEDTLERMARLLADGTGAAHSQVSLTIGGQLVPAAEVGQVDPSSDAHTVEVRHQGELLGALSVTKKRGETLSPADVKLVDDLAAQAGLLLRNVRLTEELKARIVDLRASRQRLVAAQDQERRRLERDLHDGAQQQIVAMKLKLGIAKTLAEREDALQTVALVEQLTEQTDDAVQTLRELAHGIYPPLLAAEGLEAAITTAARRATVPVTVDTDGIGRYDQDIEAALYFCVLEAITNATKYAGPTHITVRLRDTEGQLTFEVTDDGTGFDPDATDRGHGLTNMTDRTDALEGHLHITSHPGTGTTITGALPAETIGANA